MNKLHVVETCIERPATEAGKLLLEMESNKISCGINIHTSEKIINLDVENLLSIRNFFKVDSRVVVFKFFYETESLLELLSPDVLGSKIIADVFLSVNGEAYANSTNFVGIMQNVEIKNITSRESVVEIEFSSQQN
jgi:hypothetical protein